MNKKLAVFFPGIGYTVDKPLMYYSQKLAKSLEYEIKLLPYTDFPSKVKGDKDKMKQSFEIALYQTMAMLEDTDFSEYDEILFVGKSIGTVVAAKLASESEYKDKIRLVLYTPLEATFKYDIANAIAFTGNADLWVSDENIISEICDSKNIRYLVYAGADHSLETGNLDIDLEYIKEIMKHTLLYINNIENISEDEDRDISKEGFKEGNIVSIVFEDGEKWEKGVVVDNGFGTLVIRNLENEFAIAYPEIKDIITLIDTE